MSLASQNVAEDALDLPSEERLALAHCLLESVDPEPMLGAEEAWNAEITRRLARHLSGDSVPIPAAEVFARLREVAAGR